MYKIYNRNKKINIMTEIHQTINIGKVGRVITGAKSIVINNGKTFIDGKPIDELETNKMPEKEINITITGGIENLKIDSCNRVQVTGNVKKIDTTCGDVEVAGNVEGNIDTSSGNVKVTGDVGGNVDTGSGNVHCQDIAGDVETGSGNVYHRWSQGAISSFFY